MDEEEEGEREREKQESMKYDVIKGGEGERKGEIIRRKREEEVVKKMCIVRDHRN